MYRLILFILTFYQVGLQASMNPEACLERLAQPMLTDRDFQQIDSSLYHVNIFASDFPMKAYHLALEKAQELGQPRWEAKFHERLADLYSELYQKDTAKSHALAAEKIYTSLGDDLALAELYGNLRAIYADLFDFKKAFELCFWALKIYERENDRLGKATILEDLGSMYLHEKKYTDAIHYCQQSLDLLEDSEHWEQRAGSHTKIALAYQKKGQFEKALTHMTEAIRLSHYISGYYSQLHLANRYYLRGAIYEAAQLWESSIRDHQTAATFAREINYRTLNLWIYSSIGQAYLQQKRYREALDYFLLTQREMEQHKVTIDYHFNFPLRKNLATAYAGLGEFETAFHHYTQHATLMDSIFQLESEKQINELRAQYETEKKENRIDKLEKEKKTRQQFMGMGAILLAALILIAVILFRDNHFRQKMNVQLESQNQAMALQSQQNEMLLREIHHRVKNNLQTISSLLSLQSAYIKDPQILGAVEQSQHRVRSMALIHQKLYQKDQLAAVEMKDYLQTLGESIFDSYGGDPSKIEIEYPMTPLELDIDTAIPVGLIANELITNALKYAFPGQRRGKISISLREAPDGQFQLTVNDTGVGLSATEKKSIKSGFGTQLIQLLVRQMEGTIQTRCDQGLMTRVQFRRT